MEARGLTDASCSHVAVAIPLRALAVKMACDTAVVPGRRKQDVECDGGATWPIVSPRA